MRTTPGLLTNRFKLLYSLKEGLRTWLTDLDVCPLPGPPAGDQGHQGQGEQHRQEDPQHLEPVEQGQRDAALCGPDIATFLK